MTAFLVAAHSPWRIHQQQHRHFPALISSSRISSSSSSSRIRAQQGSDQDQTPSEQPPSPPEQDDPPVTLEISNSVMRMLDSPSSTSGPGLIEKNQRKRQLLQLQQIQPQDETLEQKTLSSFKSELFATQTRYVPKHDYLHPFLVATAAVFWDDEDGDDETFNLDLDTNESIDRFSSGFPRMKTIVEDDVQRLLRNKSLLPSQLFCDLNGEPLNPAADFKLEAWFLLCMYVKFKLWWKGPTSAAETALEYVNRISNFVFDSESELDRVFDRLPSFVLGQKRAAIRYGRLLHGKLKNPAADVLNEIQVELDKTKRGWAAFLMPAEENNGEGEEDVACLITHKNSVIFVDIPHEKSVWISSFLLLWAAVTSFNVGVGQIDSVLEQAVVPVGLITVILSGGVAKKVVAYVYGVSSRMITPQFVVPVPHLGAIPSFVYYSGCLPNRASIFDISAFSSIVCLTISSLLIVFSTGSQASVVVPSNLFEYSTLLNWVANRVSAEQGGTELVLNPVTLGGVLGLNFTLFSLLPVTVSDGGRMLGAAFGRPFLRSVSGFTFAFTAVSLLSKNLVLGFLWACTCAAMPEDCFQRDEVSEPGFVRKGVAVLLTAAALAAFVPVF